MPYCDFHGDDYFPPSDRVAEIGAVDYQLTVLAAFQAQKAVAAWLATRRGLAAGPAPKVQAAPAE